VTLADRLEIFSRYWRGGVDYGTVSGLAAAFRTARQFVSDVAERVKNARDWRPAGRAAVARQPDESARLQQRVRELSADCDQLAGQLALARAKPQQERFRWLLERARCPVSEDEIVRCLAAACGHDGQVSAAWVNGQLQKAGAAALAILQKIEWRAALPAAAIDERFRQRQPLRGVVVPNTLLPDGAASRRQP
jgi:hypothetical protein